MNLLVWWCIHLPTLSYLPAHPSTLCGIGYWMTLCWGVGVVSVGGVCDVGGGETYFSLEVGIELWVKYFLTPSPPFGVGFFLLGMFVSCCPPLTIKSRRASQFFLENLSKNSCTADNRFFGALWTRVFLLLSSVKNPVFSPHQSTICKDDLPSSILFSIAKHHFCPALTNDL